MHRCRREYDISPVERATFTLRLTADVICLSPSTDAAAAADWLSHRYRCSAVRLIRTGFAIFPRRSADGPRSAAPATVRLPTAAAAGAAVYDVSLDIIPHETRPTCAADVTQLYSWNLHQSINYKCVDGGRYVPMGCEYHRTTKSVCYRPNRASRLFLGHVYLMSPVIHCVSKTHQLWNGIAQNCIDRFWWRLAEIFKIR